MTNPLFQTYLDELSEEDRDDALYLMLYESIENETEPPSIEEFAARYQQVTGRLSELNIPITEKGLLQTINGWMFVLLRDHPALIIEYGRILGLTNEQWREAIEEMRVDLEDYYKDDKVMEDHLNWLEHNCSVTEGGGV